MDLYGSGSGSFCRTGRLRFQSDRMKNMSRKRFAVMISLILTLFCCSLTGFAAAKEGPPVTMEVSFVYGEMGKMGVHVPVSVRLFDHREKAFSGTLAIQTLENAAEHGSEIYEYQYPVELLPAESKDFELYVPLGQRSSEIHVILRDEKGNMVLSENHYFDVSRDAGRLVIGLISDRVEDMMYFDDVSLEYGMVQSEVVVLDETTLPADARGLELLDLLVISHYESDRLSDAQVAAVNEWVEDGGILVLGTGVTVYSTLGAFGDGLVELPIEGVFYENVNMGTEYAEKNPGDAEVNMAWADLVIPDAVVVEESDGIPLLSVVNRGSGKIGIYSYDLDEITVFVEKNPGYVAQMLTNVLGEEQSANLYYYSSYGDDTDYWNAYSLVNTGSTDRLPKVGSYAIVILAYVVIVGPGLYVFLKKRDMSRMYGTSVVAVSVAASAVVYLLGMNTRFTSQFFTAASIIDIDGASVTETSYLNVRTPDSRAFSAVIPADYQVQALTRSSRYNEVPTMEFDMEKEGTLELRYGQDETVISARTSKAFEPRFFKLTKEETLDSTNTITGSLEWSDGRISGVVENKFPFAVENAALVLYGQMYLIGDMEAGEVRELHDEELLVWPVSMSYVAANLMVSDGYGADSEDGAEVQNLLENTGKSNVFSHYLGSEYGSYADGASLVAMGPTGGVLENSSIGESADGLVLYSVTMEISTDDPARVYRSALKHKPEVTSGSIAVYGDGLSTYGSEPVAVKYFLGNDLTVETICFMPVSGQFLENPDYYYLKLFDGTVHFYNQTTQVYDRMDLTKTTYGAEELRPYLSLDNSIMVRYTPGESGTSGSTILLPHLMVTGRED